MAWVEKDPNAHTVPTPCYVQGRQPAAQAAQSHIQPGLECLHGWGIHSLLGQNFLLKCKQNKNQKDLCSTTAAMCIHSVPRAFLIYLFFLHDFTALSQLWAKTGLPLHWSRPGVFTFCSEGVNWKREQLQNSLKNEERIKHFLYAPALNSKSGSDEFQFSVWVWVKQEKHTLLGGDSSQH